MAGSGAVVIGIGVELVTVAVGDGGYNTISEASSCLSVQIRRVWGAIEIQRKDRAVLHLSAFT